MENSKTFDMMINNKIKPLLIKLAIPTIISMLITSLYNMADTFFVTKIDKSASAAISVIFSLQTLIQAVGFTIGMGCGSLVSKLLGRQEKDKANVASSSALFMALVFGLLIMIFGLIFLDKLVYLLGALPTSAEYAIAYAKFILIATPMHMMAFVMNNILRSEGHSNLSMIGLALGGILNIGLDPLFIFTFDLGVSGAGIATMISQMISTVILFSFFLFHKAETKLNIKFISKDIKLYGNIVKLGSPTLCRQGFSSVSNIALNFLAHPYGDACIAALGITNKVYMFVRSIVIGIGQGYQPILGYNYSAKKNERVKEALKFTLLIDTIVCLVATALVGFFPTTIITFFKNDPDIIKVGSLSIRLLTLSLPFLGFSTIIDQSLQVTGFSKSASFLASLRQGIIFIPLVFLLAYLFKDVGLCLAQPISDLLTAIVSAPFLFYFLKKLKLNI